MQVDLFQRDNFLSTYKELIKLNFVSIMATKFNKKHNSLSMPEKV